MPRRAFRVAYDGRPYHGFQRQPDVTTVEDVLFDALDRLDVLGDGDRKPAGYAAAGRTDAGVSARAQTVAFDAPEWVTPSALNSELSGPIRAWAHADAPPDFHATHDANWRAYRYYWHAPDGREDAERASGGAASHAPDADDERAGRALDALLGEHDFHNLTPDDDLTVRDLSGAIDRQGDFLVVALRASGFARELVRRAVSLVQDVAAGASFDRIDRVLGADPVDGAEGVAPAPPGPLVLDDVGYDLDFRVDDAAAAAVRESFADMHAERRALARVAGHVADGV